MGKYLAPFRIRSNFKNDEGSIYVYVSESEGGGGYTHMHTHAYKGEEDIANYSYPTWSVRHSAYEYNGMLSLVI